MPAGQASMCIGMRNSYARLLAWVPVLAGRRIRGCREMALDCLAGCRFTRRWLACRSCVHASGESPGVWRAETGSVSSVPLAVSSVACPGVRCGFAAWVSGWRVG
jgi:hypothetical protein